MTADSNTMASSASTMESRVARLFGLQGDAWMRHANASSVVTRFSCVSLLVIAIWSREWIGWYSLIAVVAATVWMVVNPRLFGVPSSTRNWFSRCVFGERIWAERATIELPPQFTSSIPNLANLYSCIGLAMLVYGVIALDVWLTIAGIVIVHGGKLWYLDRMVLLFEDMRQRDATFASWEYGS